MPWTPQIAYRTPFLALFKTRDEKALAEICQEVASDIEPETFMAAYRFAVEEPHSFLLVDFSPKTDKHRFRKRFDTLILT
jgi:hypothetical protein